MKVIQWLDKFNPPLGGGPTAVLALINGMQDVEFEVVTNAAYGHPLIEKYSKNAIIHSFLPYDITQHPKYNGVAKPFMLPYKVISEYTRFKNKKKYLEKSDYDILHVNGPEINYGFTTFDRLFHKPFLQKITNFKFADKPKVLTLHGMPSDQTNNPADIYAEKRMIAMFDNIICVGMHIYTRVQNYVEVINQKKNIWFIPSSIDTNNFKYTTPNQNEKLKVLFIGRLSDDWELSLSGSLIKNLPQYAEFHIIGSGKVNIIKKIKSLIERRTVIFHTNIPNELIPMYISNADVVLNPVKTEGTSRVKLEAMSCGRPVIALDNDGKYPVINGKTGYIIKDDINELLSLLEYINDNRNELEKLGENARKIVEEEFSNEVIIPKIKKIYLDLMF